MGQCNTTACNDGNGMHQTFDTPDMAPVRAPLSPLSLRMKDVQRGSPWTKQYHKVRLLGSGAQGTVFLAERKSDRKSFAIKEVVLRSSKSEELDSLRREARVGLLVTFSNHSSAALKGAACYTSSQSKQGAMLKACEVLMYTALTVLELDFEVGFKSPS